MSQPVAKLVVTRRITRSFTPQAVLEQLEYCISEIERLDCEISGLTTDIEEHWESSEIYRERANDGELWQWCGFTDNWTEEDWGEFELVKATVIKANERNTRLTLSRDCMVNFRNHLEYQANCLLAHLPTQGL